MSASPVTSGPSAAAIIAGEGLVRSYAARGRRVRALDGVTLAVAPGESVAVVGESGSGKSTLVRCLAVLERPDAGRVLWEGKNAATFSREDLRLRRRRVQVIFQDSLASFNPRFSVAEIVREPLGNFEGAGSGTQEEQVRSLLQRVGLEPALAGRRPHELSGGQQQRIAIARALALAPLLLLCDEPLSSLDVSIQAQVLELLQSLRSEGLSLLFVTHNLALVPYVSDRTLVMQNGRVVEELPSRGLGTATHPYSRALLAAVPDIDSALHHAGMA